MGDADNGAPADVQSMAFAMRAQAKEIERLRMELQRTSIKQRESIPELTPGALEEFVQEDRVAQWMRLGVGALKESPRREVVGSSAGASGVYPPFFGVIRVAYPKA